MSAERRGPDAPVPAGRPAAVKGRPAPTEEQVLALWAEAREEIARAEAAVAARARELDLLQALGRHAAEAATPEALFDATAAVLHEGSALDLVLAAFVEDGAARVLVYPARPFAAQALDSLSGRAARFLGWTHRAVACERRPSATFDPARGVRGEVREDELILLPVVRAARSAACLVVVPGGAVDEARLRVLYSASNQLSLHLDRILTVREAEADRFRAIVDSMPQGVVLADLELRPLLANGSARAMLAAAGVAAEPTLDALVDRLGLRPLVERVRAGHAPLGEAEARLGEDRCFSVTVSPLAGSRRTLAGLLFVLGDVSERRRLQQQLAQAERMSSLGRLIAGVAHELNNPLASVVGYAQLLGSAAGQAPSAKLADRLGILRREAERCRRIVENLLSFSRRRESEIRTLSLNEVVRAAAALLEYQLQVDGVAIEVATDSDLPAVRGDAHQLEQVLVNLLTNARHAIRATGRPGTVRLRTSRDAGDGVVLDVTDDGPGIPAAIRSKIFDPFFTTKPAGEGTGLGLALVHEIVTAHGGTIEVSAGPERGSTFRLRLPAHVASRPAARAAARSADAGAGRGGLILVVDDEAQVAELICEVLAEDGHRTERAADGRQALEHLARGTFDLVIADVRMPGVDGPELCRELDARWPRLRGRVVLTTGDTLGDSAGVGPCAAILRKPFDLDELRRTVRERLGSAEA